MSVRFFLSLSLFIRPLGVICIRHPHQARNKLFRRNFFFFSLAGGLLHRSKYTRNGSSVYPCTLTSLHRSSHGNKFANACEQLFAHIYLHHLSLPLSLSVKNVANKWPSRGRAILRILRIHRINHKFGWAA